MEELNNLRWSIQHLIDENEYQYDDAESTNPLREINWIFQTNKTFMKYVFSTLQAMTPEQLKQNPITVHPNHEKLVTDEGESTKDEEEFTTSQELPEEFSTSDIPTEITEETKYIEIPQEVHTIFVKSTHDEVDSSQDKSVTVVQENKQVLPVFNKTIHDEDDSFIRRCKCY